MSAQSRTSQQPANSVRSIIDDICEIEEALEPTPSTTIGAEGYLGILPAIGRVSVECEKRGIDSTPLHALGYALEQKYIEPAFSLLERLRCLLLAPGAGAAATDMKPLPAQANRVYGVLKNLAAGEAMTAKEIADKLNDDPEGRAIDESTIRSKIIPRLKKERGIKHRMGAGYYIPK
jgi:hypothetical protein